jgi:TRAP-type mannitol/chloroaromatic compound transport system permease small subunit
MQYLRSFVNGIDRFNDRTGKVISFLVVGMIGVLVYEVIMRYLFNAPTFWGHETTQHLFGSYAVLVGAYALRHRGHVNVEVFYERLSRRKQAILDLFTWSLFFLFCVILLWKGGEAALDSVMRLDRTNTPWAPPLYPLKLTIPIGTLMILLQGTSFYIRDLYMAIKGQELTPYSTTPEELEVVE